MTPATYQAYRAAREANDADLARRYLGALVIESEPAVKRLAQRLAQGDFEDLMQVGRIAVANTIAAHTDSAGSLSAIIHNRVHNALNEIISRRPQVGPKWLRTKTSHGPCKMPKDVRHAERAFFARTGREATAEDLGVDAHALEMWRWKMRAEGYEEADSDAEVTDGVVAAAMQDVSHALSRKVRRAIGDMSPQEQRVLMSRVIEELDFAVIGENEGLLRDAVTRIYNKAVAKLRAAALK